MIAAGNSTGTANSARRRFRQLGQAEVRPLFEDVGMYGEKRNSALRICAEHAACQPFDRY
jgi:hypothetical protein